MTPEIIQHLGGLPFIDRNFSTGNAYSMVAFIRRQFAKDHNFELLPIKHYLLPEIADNLRADLQKTDPIHSRKPSEKELQKINEARKYISQHKSNWTEYFEYPITVQALVNRNVISCSSFAYPQVIFLGEPSFANIDELAEQMIHESVHLWTYMLEELSSFYNSKLEKVFTLPSGTSNKHAVEVLGATYVSKVLLLWYEELNKNRDFTKRLEFLQIYNDGCLDILKSINHFSEMGNYIINQLSK